MYIGDIQVFEMSASGWVERRRAVSDGYLNMSTSNRVGSYRKRSDRFGRIADLLGYPIVEIEPVRFLPNQSDRQDTRHTRLSAHS